MFHRVSNHSDMACSSCWRRRYDDTDSDQPAKPQPLTRTPLKSFIPSRQTTSPQITPQPVTTKNPTSFTSRSHPESPKTSPPHNVSTTTQPHPSSPAHAAPSNDQSGPSPHTSVPSRSVRIGRFFVRLTKWLRFKRGEVDGRKSSKRGVVSTSKVHASDQPTETEPNPEQSSSSWPVTTSVPPTASQMEIHSPLSTKHPTRPVDTFTAAGDHPSGTRHEAALSESWIILSQDDLQKMDANKFPFNVIQMPGFAAEVERPDGFPIRVKTGSAPSYLMSTKPPYAAKYHHPSRVQKTKIVYYEVQDSPDDDWGTDGNIWFGFSKYNARVRPGLGPDSVGINISEGSLYWNGVRRGSHNFEFKSGIKIGIGIVFLSVGQEMASGANSAIEVHIIHTRQGKLVDDIHVDTLGAEGPGCFDGDYDLFAAIWTCDRTFFQVIFDEDFWSYDLRSYRSENRAMS